MQINTVPNKRSTHLDLDPLVQDIVVARKAQKLTQQQLAEMAGLSRRTIALIESGGDCTLSTLRRLTTALGLQMQANKPRLPTLDDVTRENEILFSDRYASQAFNLGDSDA